MWQIIVQALASIGSAAIMAGLNNDDMKSAREEAKILNAQNRNDTLKENLRYNKLNQAAIDLGNKKIEFDTQLLNDKINLTKKDEIFSRNLSNSDNYKNSVQNLLKPKDESWLYKGKVIGRL